MSISRSTNNTKMASYLLLFAMTVLVVEVTSSARFLSVPAFHNKIERRSDGSRRAMFMLPSLQQQQQTKIISVRGGAKDEEKNDDKEDDDDAVETGEGNDENEVSENEDETDDVSSDEGDYYDEETDEEEEEEESELASQLKKKSSDKKKSSESFDKPYFVSPSLQMYTTFGTILLSRKIDMFNPKVVGLVRYVFLLEKRRDHCSCVKRQSDLGFVHLILHII
jgi:cobalamin biosynthesis protein CobT